MGLTTKKGWIAYNKADYGDDVTVRDGARFKYLNSWESWFIFNLQKINTNQYYESVSLSARNCKHITRTHDITWKWAYNNYCTVPNWTAIFLEHLTNTSFMASFQAWTESLSGLSHWACILLPCPKPSILLFIPVGQVSYLMPSCYLGGFSLCTSKNTT
jgi:hypothetical protein